MSTQELLDEIEFPAADREKWLALASKAIGKGSFEGTLVSHTDDGIRIEPLSEASADAASLPRRQPGRPWAVVQRLDDPRPERANLQAREDLAEGAKGLAVVFEGAPNAFGYGLPATAEALETALAGIDLGQIHLRVDAHPASRASTDWLVALLTRRRTDPASLDLSFGIDPAATFAGTGRLRMSIEALQASMPQSLAHFFALGVPGVLLEADGRVYHNAGATEAQELGAMLAAAVAYLRMFEEARQALIYAAPHIGFALSVDQDQFLSMAKIRALRKLWAKIQQECSIPPAPVAIHAETSYRMIAQRDAETNILRNAIAAFAAAVGGADSIAVLPHTIGHGLADGFARRVARNTQLVMATESRLDFIADPASGSGSIEALTDALCEAAWREFQAIEADGGVLQSLADGRIQSRVLAAAEERAAQYRDRRRDIIGTTIYPAEAERPVQTLPAEKRLMGLEGAVFCQPLEATRIDQAIGDAV